MVEQHRPVIGIIACGRAVEGEPAQAVKHRYIEGVERFAEAVPLIIPSHQSAANAADIVARLDAVLLTGSNSNIEPRHYGSADPGQAPVDSARDTLSAALIKAAIAAGKPVFGICRGLQEINVALGGTLRDMRSGDGAGRHHAPDGADLDAMFGHAHAVAMPPGSVLASMTGSEQLTVNSVHFQTIDRLAPGLAVNATDADGIIEAIAATATPAPVFAVQWHPEWRPQERPHDLAFWHYVGQAARTDYQPAKAAELTP
ncbi:gamma-glutamyl-gamma-aminobutyrate hydrolase family protein [Devosia beringensis]|uniref:gamma-glutamyl-gamma-aminobutyrate hydrolase family protein n=1 Tax=Devosia beringensis TaxID=2657486 RepID=UPI00186B9245|nr:gamma-glutamyl-gamma-aminobutyrate hydrolase family protein [Devosia beringensis]